MTILAFAIIILISGCFLYLRLESFYNRYFRTYSKEINQFLHEKGEALFEIRYPREPDWEASPFKKPASVRLFSTSHYDYRIFIALNKHDREREYWIEVVTTNFCSPEISIKPSRKLKKRNGTAKNVIVVYDRCPACSFDLNKDAKVCPDCGLSFV